jgi:ArsR family transcriptional regulator, arsenate/arsenite/antimonite-responsive transcriptional repressor
MGVSKTEIFSLEQNQFATMAKALGHPARIAILQFMLQKNSCICNDIVNEIGLSQATISQHLKALKEAGIIKGIVEPPKVCYCVVSESLETLKNFIKGLAASCC